MQSELPFTAVWRVFWGIAFMVSASLAQNTLHVVNKTRHIFDLMHVGPFHNDFYFPNGLESSLQFRKGPPIAEKKRSYTFDGTLTVPEGKFLALKKFGFEISASCVNGILTNVELTVDKYILERPCPIHYNRNFTYHSWNNKATYKFFFFSTAAAFDITINVEALYRDYQRNLVVMRETNVSGTVTSYGFDGVTDYPIGLDAAAELYPPPGHSTMLSFPHFDIECDDDLNLYVNKAFIWARCDQHQTPPGVYHGNLSFRFITERHMCHSGFKVRFSYHRATELPQKLFTTDLNTAVFNCSVVFYATFSQHLMCNLEKECVQGEDESSCPYSHGPCEPGFLNAGVKCYKYVKIKTFLTWYDVSAICRKQGLTLASFSTFKQEKQFRENILHFSFTALHLFFGLRTSDPTLPAMYREVWQWSSGIMAYYVSIHNENLFKPTCAATNRMARYGMFIASCGQKMYNHFIFCEAVTPLMLNESGNINLPATQVTAPYGGKKMMRFVTCPEGHVTHDFLSCDPASQCGAEIGMTSCVANGSVTSDMRGGSVEVLMFVCDSLTQTIHYTLVCNHRAHCYDSSDESFCVHQQCPEKKCRNQECVTDAQWCDGMAHCSDGSDETCPQFVTGSAKTPRASTTGLHTVMLDGHGKYEYVSQSDALPVCPPTHFLCADHELCLPVYLRCNDVSDCPFREDENRCDDVACPGYFRCRGTAVCVHADHVCDGVFQCPQQDDEMLCNLTCPDSCRCQGLAFVCSRPFPVQMYLNLRYLDATGSGLSPVQLFQHHYLIRLELSTCGLYILPVLVFPNLQILNINNNLLTNISMHLFFELSNLKFLDLSKNPMTDFVAAETSMLLENVHSLDLSHTKLMHFESIQFRNVRNLKKLNLSHSMLDSISSSGFGLLTQIESLDLRGTQLRKYPVKMLQPLSSLREMFSDVYKLCCLDLLPEHFSAQNCYTKPSEIASCRDLLRSEIYRMFLWISCFFAVVGNAVSFAARIYLQRGKPSNSFNVFISNLNVADFFMGLYLVVIGSADQVYRGTYLWYDEGWKAGAGCKIAGFLSLLSCEMSAFVICFITLDRFLVMRFPFSQLHFRCRSATMVSGLNWLVSIILAAVPLLPVTSHWEFYSQTDICIPLPVTRQHFRGHFYSFGILIVFNFLLFILIAVGQVFIYMSIRGNSMATDKKNERETAVARRLLTVVMSDFLCWFPIGLLGLLASNDVPIPGEVNVTMAVFALPLNSALNPFLYTFNLLMEKRRKAAEQRILRMLQARLDAKTGTR